MRHLTGRAAILAMLTAFFSLQILCGPAAAQQIKAAFEDLSNELVLMDEIFGMDSNKKITFSSKQALSHGFSPVSIRLAKETAAFTNDLIGKAVRAAKASGIDYPQVISIEGIKMDMKKYPLLAAYDREALLRARKGESSAACFEGIIVMAGSPQDVCGSKPKNPVPGSAAPRIAQGPYKSLGDAQKALKRLGYFRAWWVPGGDWTRNQTYRKSVCGKNTFRDHARPPYKSGKQYFFKEQDYTGPISGEPNPVMSTDPWDWPYLTWPSYVYWWHKKF